MLEKKTEPRVTVDLPVRIWGMSARGQPFSQHARAQNITSEGALLQDVENDLKIGDVIGVQCEDKKARCTVIWTEDAGGIKKNQVGLRLLADQRCPWEKHLPPKVPGRISISRLNRRKYHRHKIGVPIEVRDQRMRSPIRVNTTDVSGNGCYLELMMPMPVGTVVRVEIWMDKERLSITAMVRTCDPGVGNGIEFTGLPPDKKARLQAYFDEIDPQRAFAEHA